MTGRHQRVGDVWLQFLHPRLHSYDACLFLDAQLSDLDSLYVRYHFVRRKARLVNSLIDVPSSAAAAMTTR